MANPTCLAMLLAVAALCGLLQSTHAIEADELTFAMIQKSGATGQWATKMERGNKGTNEFLLVNCPSPIKGTCSAQTPPIQQDRGDVLRITYTWNTTLTSFTTHQNQEATHVESRLCYTLWSSFDRAWRKKNKPYPRLSQNCPRKAPKVALTPGEAVVGKTWQTVFDFDEQDEVPTATWFSMLWVYCGNKVCAYETTEGKNHFETEVEMGITMGMRVSAIILSVFGPAFFVVFYIMDHIKYKKTGKPILF